MPLMNPTISSSRKSRLTSSDEAILKETNTKLPYKDTGLEPSTSPKTLEEILQEAVGEDKKILKYELQEDGTYRVDIEMKEASENVSGYYIVNIETGIAEYHSMIHMGGNS